MTRGWTTSLALLGLAAALVIGAHARVASEEHTIVVDGLERHYLVHAPPDLSYQCAVVFALHGGGAQGKSMNTLTGLNRVSDANGFLVVYPDGDHHNWNDGRGLESKADDVAFMSALIDAVHAQYSTDARRVYVTGISNGAFMSYTLARDLSTRIAAIAPVAGALGEGTAADYHPRAPVSVMAISGLQDPLVPYTGGDIARRLKRGRALSVPQSVATWVAIDHCLPTPAESELPDTAGDGTHIHVQDWTGGRGGTEVMLYAIDGGGHTWPGGLQYLPELIIGKTSHNMQASEAIWSFFVRHPRP